MSRSLESQTFIIDGSGVYVSRNAESYLYGWMELAHNRCYRNGINGAVVHKTDRAYVHGNVIYDNGQVSLNGADAPHVVRAASPSPIHPALVLTPIPNTLGAARRTREQAEICRADPAYRH